MSALVSIIIPVYNLEDYIENCLNSVLNQTYDNLEIICIDDGSIDKSADIIKKYQNNDQRIVYLYQENRGVSSARNKGIDNAHGDYIMFVDGDDFIHFQAIELLIKCISDKKVNIVFPNLETVYSSDKIIMSEIKEYNCVLMQENDLFTDEYSVNIGGKFFDANFLKRYRFQVGITNAEDYLFLIKAYYDAKDRIGYKLDSKLYYYYIREDSMSHKQFNKNSLTEITANDIIMDFFADKNDCYLKSYAISYLFKLLLRIRTQAIGSEFEKETFKMVKNSWKKWHGSMWKSSGISVNEKIFFTVFYYSRHLYELARQIQDPTMKDFYKQRKKRS